MTRGPEFRLPGPHRASGETEPFAHEVRALPRSPHRRIAALIIGVILVLGASTPTVAHDPVPVPSDVPSAQPERPTDGVVFSDPRTEAIGDPSVQAIVKPNFQEEVIWGSGTFIFPLVVEFAADGRVFVAEKAGTIQVFSSLTDPSPTLYADLSTNVHGAWDRGLLGMALDPDFTTNGRMYVAYTYNAPIGGTAPVWPDECPDPPGVTTDGCVVSSRLSVLTNNGSTEEVLINDWCQQFPSHSASDIVFDAEGALIVAGGDGASFGLQPDYGQLGGSSESPTPRNPCGDPPGGVGGAMTAPTAEGGALRSQDIRTTADSLGLNGTIIRINRFTGAPMPDNPRTTGGTNERRIIGYGTRNPFRMAIHPANGDLWFGDVGWNTWEEINHLDPDGSVVPNFGWPCREGNLNQALYDGLTLCDTLASGFTNPDFVYRHTLETVPGDGCGSGGSSISAMAFYAGGPYPDTYDNALFFGDYSRKCIWVMRAGAGGVPNPATVELFMWSDDTHQPVWPVNMTTGPGGDIFYVSAGGSVRRIRYLAGNEAPLADIAATPTDGDVPLAVTFNASGSTDPDEDALTYAWDFGDDDGQFDDAFGIAPSHTYTVDGSYQARVRVSDGRGGTDVDQLQINAGNTPPQATIELPLTSLRWSVGQEVVFRGRAADPNAPGGLLPASAFSWQLILAHCPDDCHEHVVSTMNGVTQGDFAAPDHDYPSHLILRLTVDDGDGASDVTEVVLQPKTVTLSIRSVASGLKVAAGTQSKATPYNVTAIAGSAVELNAPAAQLLDGFPYDFVSWSNGGSRVQIVRPTTSTTYTATYDGGFTDVPPGTKFRADIAWLVREELTSGCGPSLFCPNGLVTRGQMATFLVRALGLAATGTDYFSDDNANKHEANINRLAAAGITAGCTPTTFCPDGLVTRAQMATFLGRAFELPPSSTNWFSDDNGNQHEARINALRASGITSGCGGTRFCPNGLVTRGQMAAFLHRAMTD